MKRPRRPPRVRPRPKGDGMALDEVAARGLVLSLKIIRRDAFVFDMFYVGYVGEGDVVVVVDSVF